MNQMIWTFVLFWSMPLTTRADVTVTCILTSDCVLPCTSPYHDIIHWHKGTNTNSAHTFYDKADHLEFQDAEFKGRTSLFTDQISQGNASLLLRMIRFEDEARWRCYTATSSDNKEQFVLLKVKVPVKWVDLNMTSEGISCSTKDVFPQPKISWYRDGNSENKFIVNPQVAKERLFSVSSVLPLPVKENTTYSCYISLGDESQSYTASLRKENVDINPGQDFTIHCPVYQENTGNNTVTLTFGESTTILSYSQMSQSPTITEQWRGKTLHFARDGTVTIHNLENNEDTGTFTCERITAQSRQVLLTSVQITSVNCHIGAGASAGIAVGVVAVICIIATLIFCLCKKEPKKRNKENSKENGVKEELKSLSEENPAHRE